jgi:hypothetical protein
MGTIHEFVSPAPCLAGDAAAHLVAQTTSPNGGMVS